MRQIESSLTDLYAALLDRAVDLYPIMRLCLDPAPFSDDLSAAPLGGEDASNYVEHVDVLSLAPGLEPRPQIYWDTIRDVIRIKRERAAKEALVSLPTDILQTVSSAALGGESGLPRPSSSNLEKMVREEFERALLLSLIHI